MSTGRRDKNDKGLEAKQALSADEQKLAEDAYKSGMNILKTVSTDSKLLNVQTTYQLLDPEKQKEVRKQLKYAVTNGNYDACYSLGLIYEAKAKKYAEKAAILSKTITKKDDLAAREKILNAKVKTGKNYDKVFQYLEIAAAKGNHKEALFFLGKMHFEGWGILKYQDQDKGLAYLIQAAKGDNKEAAFYLGKMYFEGNVVPKDQDKGLAYLTQAAEGGNKEAALFLSDTYANKQNDLDSKSQSLKYLKMAAENPDGNLNALRRLASEKNDEQGKYVLRYCTELMAAIAANPDPSDEDYDEICFAFRKAASLNEHNKATVEEAAYAYLKCNEKHYPYVYSDSIEALTYFAISRGCTVKPMQEWDFKKIDHILLAVLEHVKKVAENGDFEAAIYLVNYYAQKDHNHNNVQTDTLKYLHQALHKSIEAASAGNARAVNYVHLTILACSKMLYKLSNKDEVIQYFENKNNKTRADYQDLAIIYRDAFKDIDKAAENFYLASTFLNEKKNPESFHLKKIRAQLEDLTTFRSTNPSCIYYAALAGVTQCQTIKNKSVYREISSLVSKFAELMKNAVNERRKEMSTPGDTIKNKHKFSKFITEAANVPWEKIQSILYFNKKLLADIKELCDYDRVARSQHLQIATNLSRDTSDLTIQFLTATPPKTDIFHRIEEMLRIINTPQTENEEKIKAPPKVQEITGKLVTLLNECLLRPNNIPTLSGNTPEHLKAALEQVEKIKGIPHFFRHPTPLEERIVAAAPALARLIQLTERPVQQARRQMLARSPKRDEKQEPSPTAIQNDDKTPKNRI